MSYGESKRGVIDLAEQLVAELCSHESEGNPLFEWRNYQEIDCRHWDEVPSVGDDVPHWGRCFIKDQKPTEGK